MTMHPRNDFIRLYEPRKEGGRGLVSIENSVDGIETKTQRLQRKE